MKGFISLFSLVLCFTSLSFTQVNINNAIDFTADDLDGVSHHLFSYLEAGNYVLLKFNQFNWSACVAAVGDLNKAYDDYGQNNGGLIVIAAFNSGTDAACEEWDNTNNVKYPSISGNGGGATINNDYNPSAYPTIILIDPDGKIVEKDIYPTNLIASTLEKYDIGGTGIEMVNNLNNSSHLSVKCINLQQVNLSIPADGTYDLAVFSADGRMLGTLSTGYLSKGEHSIAWNVKTLSHGVYFLKVSSNHMKAVEKILVP